MGTSCNVNAFCHDDVIKWKHFPRNWPFVRGIHRSPVNSPHKGQWRGALMFSLICVWINDWVNNREAGDLRLSRPLWRHCNALLILCDGNSSLQNKIGKLITGVPELMHIRFVISFVLDLDRLLNKQLCSRWFEMQVVVLVWRHCNSILLFCFLSRVSGAACRVPC